MLRRRNNLEHHVERKHILKHVERASRSPPMWKSRSKFSLFAAIFVIALTGFAGYIKISIEYLENSYSSNLQQMNSDGKRGKVEGSHSFPEPSKSYTDGKSNLHMVFSTDCSEFQHWQSYLLFFSAMNIGQAGKITRLASGCSNREKVEIESWHEEHVKNAMSERFGLHFTPQFSSIIEAGEKIGEYKYFNKPFGLLHWLEHGEGMGVDPTTGKLFDEELVVILIDPDMLLLRPIEADFSNEREVIFSDPHNEDPKHRVEHGSPFAQKYGLGRYWLELNLTHIAGSDSPAKLVDAPFARKFYPAGPPYIATGKDMYSIARKWTEFAPKVHAEFPDLLAEMYAYSIAAAHLELPHHLVNSLMVSKSKVEEEGFPFVDAIPLEEVCEFASQPDHSKYPLPSVVHYCQTYVVGEWYFNKKYFPADFFTCKSPLMAIPPTDLGGKDYHYKLHPQYKDRPDQKENLEPYKAKREAFMMCAIISALNEASLFFKNKHCVGISEIRTDKSFNFFDMYEFL